MKKFLLFVTAVAVALFVVTGCAQNESGQKKQAAKQTVSQTQSKETQKQTEVKFDTIVKQTNPPTEAKTEKPTQKPTTAPKKPTPAPTKKPSQPPQTSFSYSDDGLFIADYDYYTMADANYIQLNDDGTAVMQINLMEAMLQVTGTYQGDTSSIVTFGDMVGPQGNLVVKSGVQLHNYTDGLMVIYGMGEKFELQGWNTPIAYLDGCFFRSPKRPDFSQIHNQ